MPRRHDHNRAQLKEMSLTAAIAILNENGINTLTARSIARRIGYTVGTLYNIFENFNDIILHINAQTMDDMYAQFAIVNARKLEPMQRILQVTQAYIEFAHNHGSAWQLLFEPRISAEPQPPWYQEKINRLFTIVEQALLPVLNNSPQQSVIAAKVLWTGLYGICILSINKKLAMVLGETAQTLAYSLVTNYLYGLKNNIL